MIIFAGVKKTLHRRNPFVMNKPQANREGSKRRLTTVMKTSLQLQERDSSLLRGSSPQNSQSAQVVLFNTSNASKSNLRRNLTKQALFEELNKKGKKHWLRLPETSRTKLEMNRTPQFLLTESYLQKIYIGIITSKELKTKKHLEYSINAYSTQWCRVFWDSWVRKY